MKNSVITIRVGALEKLRIEREAQKKEMNVSEYIRYLLQKEKDRIFEEEYAKAI